jgi:hypothetical protein
MEQMRIVKFFDHEDQMSIKKLNQESEVRLMIGKNKKFI